MVGRDDEGREGEMWAEGKEFVWIKLIEGYCPVNPQISVIFTSTLKRLRVLCFGCANDQLEKRDAINRPAAHCSIDEHNRTIDNASASEKDRRDHRWWLGRQVPPR